MALDTDYTKRCSRDKLLQTKGIMYYTYHVAKVNCSYVGYSVTILVHLLTFI
jgi:hypothetical protein